MKLIKKSLKKVTIALSLSLITTLVIPTTLPVIQNNQTVQASTVNISKKNLTLEAGKSTILKVSGTKKSITWSSSAKSVAAVTSKGEVIAQKAGTAVITAKVSNQNYTCRVTVKKGPYAITAKVLINKLDYKLDDCIKLGKYKGITAVCQADDKEVEKAIQAALKEKGTAKQVKEGNVANGDTVNIDYTGKKAGVAFEGGTASSYDLKIGSGKFIDGFEAKLIGVKVGDTVDLNLTFPKNYPAADLAGQDVVFTVTVNYIHGEKIVPELTEEFVKANTDYNTVEEYRDGIRKTLEETMRNKAWEQVVKNAKVKHYPKSELDDMLKTMTNYYKNYAESVGLTWKEFLKREGVTEATFKKQLKTYAEQSVASRLVFYGIVKAENMNLTYKEYKAGKKQLMKEWGYPDEDSIVKKLGEDNLKKEILTNKVKKLIVDNAKSR